MTFGEKLKTVRLSLNISQSRLAAMTGISERSLYTYEQLGILPRSSNLRKIADALNISVHYLLDEEETDTNKNLNQYNYNAAQEAAEILSRVSALFTGNSLNDNAKDLLFQSIMQVYLDSKQAVRKKLPSRKRAAKSKSSLFDS